MGDTVTIAITPLHLAILSGIAGLAVALFGGVAKLFWNRMERHMAEQNARMDRAKAEVIALVKERFERQEAQNKEREARNERHFREIRAELRDLNTRVGRLEGRMGVQGGSAGQSGQSSP